MRANLLDDDDTPAATTPSTPASQASAASPTAAAAAPFPLTPGQHEPQTEIELVDGEVIDATDPDAVIDAYEQIEALDRKVYAVKVQLKQALAVLSTGEAKTRRVGGKRRLVVLTMPSAGWNQSVLKEAWNAYPALRDELLRVDAIAVKAREFGKAKETSKPTDPAWEMMRNMIAGAETPPSGNPTVKIEK